LDSKNWEKNDYRDSVVQLVLNHWFAGHRLQVWRFDCCCRGLLFSLYARVFFALAGFAAANDHRACPKADGIYTQRKHLLPVDGDRGTG
jgi:hypothetical protein